MLSFLTFSTVGLALAIVGVVFLANAMGVRTPRRLLAEYFGAERELDLRAVHDQLRVKAEVATGFVMLMLGFSLQIVAQLLPAPATAHAAAPLGPRLQAFLALTALVVVLASLLRLACQVWSRAAFRRLLSSFLAERGSQIIDRRPALAREIGELLGVAPHVDDSTGEYAERVRAALRLPPGAPGESSGDEPFAPVRKVGRQRLL